MENEKPRFEEIEGVTTMNLPYAGLKFNAQRVGPRDFYELRDVDYGEGFWMPTIPELAPLIHASLENKRKYETAKHVVMALKNHTLTGNTAIHYFPKGMFVDDPPDIGSMATILTPTLKVLEERLGKHEEKGVMLSDDGRLRFTPDDFKRGPQTSLELSTNKGLIAVTGSGENAEDLARASDHYKKNPRFLVLEGVDHPTTRIVCLDSGHLAHKLIINANKWEGYQNHTYGVQGIKKEEKKHGGD